MPHAVTCPKGLDPAATGHYRDDSHVGVTLGAAQTEQEKLPQSPILLQGSLRPLNKAEWKSPLLKSADGTELRDAAAPGRGLVSQTT